MKIKRWFGIAALSCLTLASIGVEAQAPQLKKWTAAEAKDHIGEQATVCGKVTSTRYAATTRGKPTFLNLDKAYPNQVFTVLIWGENRAKFGTPEEQYRDKQVCVTGKITEYRGAPEMVISDPAQVTNGAGQRNESPTPSSSIPAGATAKCRDGSYSFSHTRRGTCSHHGGVARWLL
jgi:Protein of unknown function (DUF3761)